MANLSNEYVLVFDGLNDWVALPPAAIPVGNAITCSFWAYGGDGLPTNISVLSALDANGNRVLNIHLPWSNGSIYFDCGNNGGSYDRIDKQAQPADYKGKWSHWAFTKDAATGEMKIYLNGQLWHSGTGKTLALATPSLLQLGCYVTGGLFYLGKLAEVQFWNRARTQAEIQQDMSRHLRGDEPGLVSYWPLTEGSGPIARDKTSNANHGTIHGNPSWEISTLSLAPGTPSPSEIGLAVNLPTDSKIKLKSWKGDYLHRPDSAQGVTTWSTGVGNEWTVEAIADNKIKLKSWKGDYLHRPDSAQGVTTWSTGVGNEWTVEAIADNKIKLKSWKGDYLHRPDSPPDVTTWSTGIGNEWELEIISIQKPGTVPPRPSKNLESVLTFDGQNNFITCPEGVVTNSYTKEAWVKLAEPLSPHNNIISGHNHAFFMPKGWLGAGHNGQLWFVKDSSPSPANTWLHVAVTYDSQTKVMCLYRDGRLVSQASNVPPFTPSDRTRKIGSHFSSYLFKGQMAEARVWNKVLSQTEIQSNLPHRLVGNELGLVGYWPLNEGSGPTARDQTNNARNGKIHGHPSWEVSTLSLAPAPASPSSVV